MTPMRPSWPRREGWQEHDDLPDRTVNTIIKGRGSGSRASDRSEVEMGRIKVRTTLEA